MPDLVHYAWTVSCAGMIVAVLLSMLVRQRIFDGRDERNFVVTFTDGKTIELNGYGIDRFFEADDPMHCEVWIQGKHDDNAVALFVGEDVVSIVEKG